MAYHHLAIVTHDMQATHRFYTEAMGFELVHAEKAQTGKGSNWSKHFFYDTGNGEMMAFWEIHHDDIPDDHPTSISRGLGLPAWTNHIAFRADSVDDLRQKRARLLSAGQRVTEIDHNWCRSIYATDPNGILVEFCVTTRAFADGDEELAFKALTSDDMADEPAPVVEQFEPEQATQGRVPLG